MDEVYAATLAEVRAAYGSDHAAIAVNNFIAWAETTLSHGQRVQPDVLRAHVRRARAAIAELEQREGR